MKKLLLSLSLVLVGSTAMSQVIFSVEAPAPISGFYSFTSNGDGSSWGLANLSGVNVIDTVQIANDGTAGTNADGKPFSGEACDSLGMQSLAGKIALIYRGTCGFGRKALNAQAAGAVAVIIVNRDETLINMNGGTEGAGCTIPVVFVTNSTGTAIVNSIAGGNDVVAFIGDKTGYFANDISIFDNRALRTNFGSIPAALAQSSAEISTPLGVWCYNYGQNSQTGVTMTATVTANGSSVFTQTTAPVSIASGDSVYFTTPNFSLPSYASAKYELSYTVNYGTTDEFPADNLVTSRFDVSDSLWSIDRLDDNQIVGIDGFYRPNTLPTVSFRACNVLKNPNASRIAMDGVYYGGVTVSTADTAAVPSIEGLELQLDVFTWNDADKTTGAGTFNLINQVANASYVFPADLQDSTIFIPLSAPFRFVNNQDYLVCVSTFEPLLFTAFSTNDFYDENILQNDVARFPIFADDAPVNVAAGFGISPSIALRVGTSLSIDELTAEASAYPNPSKDVITVKVNAEGDAVLKVTDMAGRQVLASDVKIVGGTFTTNVSGMNSGQYIFNLEFTNGVTSRFNVVVTK